MIAVTTWSSRFLYRAVAPWVWSSEARVARKLEGFAATEAGSALDMLKAAELTDDPRLRRLFFRHATDEARHAEAFRRHARALDPEVRYAASEYRLIHATRQNLYLRLGLVRFVAFVYLAERRGEQQFLALRDHFAGRAPELERLFGGIAREERFHVAYSKRLLDEWRSDGRAVAVWTALVRVRAARAAAAWRRSGRVLGDATAKLLLALLYLIVLPLFAIVLRAREPARAGWKRRPSHEPSLVAARRQY